MKKILILSLLFAFIFIVQASAGSTNFITAGSTTHSYTGESTGAGANSIDENWSTYQGTSGTGGGNFWSGTLISQHTFSQSRLITQISFRFYGNSYGYGSDESDSHGNYYVQYWNGSSWVTFSGGSGSWSGGEGLVTCDSGVVNIYPNITTTMVRVYAYSEASASGDGSTTYGNLKLYEIEAFGTAYQDKGLRYYKNGTVYKIGVEDLTSSHKFRCYIGNTKYGIPLLATNDSDASPWRIYDGSAVKAAPKVN